LYNEELNNLYSPSDIIRVNKSSMMRLAGMWHTRNAYKILVGKPEGRESPGDIGLDEGIILKRVLLEKQCMTIWTGLI
jgi:hypothetical protein